MLPESQKSQLRLRQLSSFTPYQVRKSKQAHKQNPSPQLDPTFEKTESQQRDRENSNKSDRFGIKWLFDCHERQHKKKNEG
jgi:hypothetical protein